MRERCAFLVTVGGAVFGTKASEFKTKDTTWSLGPPKPISKEFLSLAWNTKFLANFENHHTLLVFEIKKYGKSMRNTIIKCEMQS